MACRTQQFSVLSRSASRARLRLATPPAGLARAAWPRAQPLRELLREVGAPGARHALVFGAPIDKALRDCGLTVLAVVPVGAFN